MNELQLIRDQVSTERRHMAEVRAACASAIARAAPEDTLLDEFCQACADYLVYIVGRFNAQDQAHCDILGPRLAPGDAANRHILDELAATLARNREAIASLAAALEARRAGQLHVPQFVAACQDYLRFYEEVLAKHRHVIYHLFDRHYGIEEWRRASLVDADAIVEERVRYGRVRAKLPPGVDLATTGPAA